MNGARLIHEQVTEAALRTPEATALVDGERRLGWAELEDARRRLSAVLQEAGVRRGDRVGLLLPKSAEAVTAIYAILAVGAAYVPIDPKAPAARARYILADCGVAAVVTSLRLAKRWSEIAASPSGVSRWIVADAAAGDPLPPAAAGRAFVAAGAGAPGDPQPVAVEPEDAAYVLYTSGSTGEPKGVVHTHRSCLAFVRWAVEEYGVGAGDRLVSVAPLHFDLSTFDLFAASRVGAPLALLPPQVSIFPKSTSDFIDDHGITVWYSVPSILIALTEHGGLAAGDLPSLRLVLFAGEVFPVRFLARLMRLLPRAEFANWYGPTETNVCTHQRVPAPPAPGGGEVPIGRPLPCVRAAVLGEDGAPVAPGETGELWVAGETLMSGYFGDPERTASRLVEPPAGATPPGPYYRTGDLVVQQGDGAYRFCGRRDDQVKSRGYRIELGEVESALYAHPAVRDCTVVAVPDERITNRLVAFLVTDVPVGKAELARHCGERLPRYMIPEAFHLRDALPKTSTGKADRRRLAEEAG